MSAVKEQPFSDSNNLYRSIFELSAVSLWVEDISALKVMIAGWKAAGVGDIRAHLLERTEDFERAVRSIGVVDVNDATLALYEVKEKAELLGPLDRTLDLSDPRVVAGLLVDIQAIAEGKRYIEVESAAITPSGKRLDLNVKIHIPAASDPQSYMLVNVIDVTERNALARRLDLDRFNHYMLLDNLPDSVYLKDREGRFVVANSIAAHIVGLTNPRDILGKTDFELFPADEAARYAEEERRVLERGETVIREWVVELEPGSPRTYMAAKVPARNDAGDIIGLVGVTRDVSELKRAETALRTSESRYRGVFSDAPIGIFHATSTGKLIDANPQFAHSVGFDTPAELIEAMNEHDFHIWYDDGRRRDAAIDRVLTSPGWLRFSGNFRRKDGTPGVGRLMMRAVAAAGIDGGTVIEGFMEDITVQARAEEELARERLLLQSLMNNIPDRIYFKDLDSKFTLVNKAQAASFGIDDPDAVVGTADADYFTAVHAEAARADEQEIIASGSAIVNKEERETWPDRRDTWALTTKMPLRSSDGSITGTFGISRDVTLERTLQQQVIRSHRLESLGQLATGIAHQFNNINAVVKGYLSLTVNDPALPSTFKRNLLEALDGVDRAVEITRRLEILTGRPTSGPTPVHIELLIPEFLLHARLGIKLDDVVIRTDLADTPAIEIDRISLEFVFSSLMSNAAHALLGRTTRSVTIRTRSESGYSALEVVDTGCGIPEADLPKIFTPFFTRKGEWAPQGSPQTAVRGVGLSLAVCRSLVTSYGGRIEVESAVDRGTTITAWFPHEPASEQP